MLLDPDGLSQVKFCEGAELIVAPDVEAWEGKHLAGASISADIDTLGAKLQDGLHELYSVILVSCQHVAELISMVPCAEGNKQDWMSDVCNQSALVLQMRVY